MRFRTIPIWPLLGAAMTLFSSLVADAADLHPLGKKLPGGVISFELRDLSRSGAELAIEAIYRPYRQWDVRREWNLHLFDSPWRSGSREWLSINRTETHTMRQTARVTGSSLTFTVPLHATEAGFEAYQLASVRVGRVVFERWFAASPELAPEFGLRSAADSLQGTIRMMGIAAAPLNGSLPLWPALRTVRLTVSPVERPTVQIWDPVTKHHWDGWRFSTPEYWTGGRTILTRRAEGATVWRAHQYSEYGPAGEPPQARPTPPADALAGVSLEIFWPQGAKLEFPDVIFAESVTVIAIRVASLTARARDILARSVERRPGTEQHSVTAAEWAEIQSLAAGTSAVPAEFEITKASGGKDLLEARRRNLVEPWLYLFGIKYDSDRRFSISALVLNPKPWGGPLPQ